MKEREGLCECGHPMALHLKKRKYNIGDKILFASIGMYFLSIIISFSIKDISFAESVVEPIVLIGLIGSAYSAIINKNELKTK